MFISQIANVKNIWHPGVKDVDRTLVDLVLSNNKHMMFFLFFLAGASSFPQNSTDHLACSINYLVLFLKGIKWKHNNA